MIIHQYPPPDPSSTDSRQKNRAYRPFVANQSISRNKLKKKAANYLESADNPLKFASDFDSFLHKLDSYLIVWFVILS